MPWPEPRRRLSTHSPRPVADEHRWVPASAGWHYAYDRCAGCGTTTRPHLSGGLCVDCYRAAHGIAPDAPETVPARDPDGAPIGRLSIELDARLTFEERQAALAERISA
ncbi:MAG TPA: hypothetical protein VFL91_26465 [Thermomicrobiales bacterium]|nr:hypothetical protein [Thermomicrobiales bacterium]